MPSTHSPRHSTSGRTDWERFRSGRGRFFAARARDAELYRLEASWARRAGEPVSDRETERRRRPWARMKQRSASRCPRAGCDIRILRRPS